MKKLFTLIFPSIIVVACNLEVLEDPNCEEGYYINLQNTCSVNDSRDNQIRIREDQLWVHAPVFFDDTVSVNPGLIPTEYRHNETLANFWLYSHYDEYCILNNTIGIVCEDEDRFYGDIEAVNDELDTFNISVYLSNILLSSEDSNPIFLEEYKINFSSDYKFPRLEVEFIGSRDHYFYRKIINMDSPTGDIIFPNPHPEGKPPTVVEKLYDPMASWGPAIKIIIRWENIQ